MRRLSHVHSPTTTVPVRWTGLLLVVLLFGLLASGGYLSAPDKVEHSSTAPMQMQGPYQDNDADSDGNDDGIEDSLGVLGFIVLLMPLVGGKVLAALFEVCKPGLVYCRPLERPG